MFAEKRSKNVVFPEPLGPWIWTTSPLFIVEFKFANICPYNNYARKNIGYLIAFSKKNNFIVETDDDNSPKKNFGVCKAWDP